MLTDKVDVEGDVAGVHLCDTEHLLLSRRDAGRVVSPPLPLPSCRAQPGGVHCKVYHEDTGILGIFVSYFVGKIKKKNLKEYLAI